MSAMIAGRQTSLSLGCGLKGQPSHKLAPLACTHRLSSRHIPDCVLPQLDGPSRGSSGVCWSAAQDQPAAIEPVASIDPVKRSEMVKGCRTLLAELQGLDFPRNEVRTYFIAAQKLPRGFKGEAQDMTSARAVLELLLQKDSDGDALPPSAFNDMAGLTLTQAVLNELWRWRRRGGGMNYDEAEGRPSETALAEIQNFQPEDIDRISSSLLDNLPITDQQKQDMSGGVQKMVFGAFQGAVWGSLGATILFLIIFNFLRSA